jgi:hypothetical protein
MALHKYGTIEFRIDIMSAPAVAPYIYLAYVIRAVLPKMKNRVRILVQIR